MRKRERFFVLLLALFPQILWAQMSVVTYNQSAKQVLLCTANQRHNIDTLYVVDEKDINTVCFANDGTVTEMTNSLGTLNFEYDDDCVDVTYHVDGQLLSRHVYHYADTEEYRQFRKQTAEWQGKMDTDNIVVNFLNSKAFQTTYEFQDNLFDNLGNPAKAMYDNVIKPAVYGDKTNMNGIDQAVDDIIGVVLKCAVPDDLLMEKTVGKWLKNPKETFGGFVSSLHDWLFKNYKLQKQHNDYEMAWRQGLREKVMRNEITMEEATAKVSEVIEKKKEFIRNNSVDPIFDKVAVVTSKDENGEEKYDYQVNGGINEVGVPLEALQAPYEGDIPVVWNNIKNILSQQHMES